MLTSVYDTLELFDTAFANTGSVATSLVIDCTGATRWAEGVEHGRPWRIEAQQSQGRPIDGVMLKRAYGHMGRHLFVAFHGAAQRKVHALGWRDAEAQAAVEATVRPVLEAMDFHMGMAVMPHSTWVDCSAWHLSTMARAHSSQRPHWVATPKSNWISSKERPAWACAAITLSEIRWQMQTIMI